jgi:PAS domain S-box-containing protein
MTPESTSGDDANAELETLRRENTELRTQLNRLSQRGSREPDVDALTVDALRDQLRVRETALAYTPDFTYLFDLRGRFTYINHALLSLWQRPFEEAVGKDFFDLEYPPDLATKLQREIQQVIHTRQQVRDETPYTGADGRTGFYEYIFVPVFASDGSVEAVAGSTRDVTDRKRAEAALRESEERFSDAFAHAPVGMVLTTPSGRFLEANQGFLNLLGYRKEEITARTTDDVTHPDDIAISLAFDQASRQGSNPPPLEKRYIRKDGTQIWTRASGNMRRDTDGGPTQFIGIIEDITQRKRAEEGLRASEERLHQVFTQSPVAICLLRGRNLVFELVNPHYQELFPDRALLGRPLLEAIPEVSSELLAILHGVLNTGETFAATEFRIPLDRDADSVVEDYWFNFVYHPLRELDGTVSAVVAVAVDVTSQVATRQRLERANRELEEFAYVASHDLQEPLRMVNIYTQLIVRELQPPVTETMAAFASQVNNGVQRMEQLLKDLLSFSRITLDEHKEAAIANTDLNAVLTQALATLQSRIEECGAVITVDELPFVRGDESQLIQVFQNFLSNALKYRKPHEAPLIHVSAHRQRDEWVVGFRDNGIGFEQAQAERVFGLFKRLHTHEFPGTGLGLAICKRLIERHGGRVWAESKPGAGAAFWFALPVVQDL